MGWTGVPYLTMPVMTQWYCRYTGRPCEYATEWGYCKVTACVKQDKGDKGWR